MYSEFACFYETLYVKSVEDVAHPTSPTVIGSNEDLEVIQLVNTPTCAKVNAQYI